jgi:hypothetical protein
MADDPNGATTAITPTLEEVVRRRADLYHAILALEGAAARPASGREEAWVDGVIAALGQVEREIVDHIEITERPEGLYDEIVDAAPRLSGNIQRLREEHPEMQDLTTSLRARLTASPARHEEDVVEARDAIHHLLGLLVKHRQRGADLLWEAYSLDTGGAE